jgi:hypothetical protein
MFSIHQITQFTYLIQFENKYSDEFLKIIYSIQHLPFCNKIINDTSDIQIYSSSVISSIQNIKFNYENTLQLISCLYQQQKVLETIGYSFFNFHLEDIIHVDNHFFCVNERNICKLNQNNLFIKYPFDRTFSSPELLQLTSLPNTIPYSSFTYTFGLFIYYCFFGKQKDNRYEENMDTIKYTDLYWFFKKAFSEERILFFIN